MLGRGGPAARGRTRGSLIFDKLIAEMLGVEPWDLVRRRRRLGSELSLVSGYLFQQNLLQ